MGQKVHPVGFRLGFVKPWRSRWFARRGYAEALHEDLRIRSFIKERVFHAGVSSIDVERKADQVRIIVHAARPGIIIGKKGSEVEKLKSALAGMTRKPVQLDILEVRKAELDAQLIAEQVAAQLERRVAFRRAMKKTVQSTMRLGAQGVQIACAGRLAGAEIARREWYREGRMPLNTLRADIDYGFTQAKTTYGVIGVKVWVYHGDVAPEVIVSGQEREVIPSIDRVRRLRGAGPPKG
jgi:small subunit ribosomal protein S3